MDINLLSWNRNDKPSSYIKIDTNDAKIHQTSGTKQLIKIIQMGEEVVANQ